MAPQALLVPLDGRETEGLSVPLALLDPQGALVAEVPLDLLVP